MITGAKEELDDIAKNYLCSEHKTPVVVTWHAQENAYALRCQNNEYPEQVTKAQSLTDAYKQGEELPEPIVENIKRSQRRRNVLEGSNPQLGELALVPPRDLGTNELLTPELIQALVSYATHYGLDPGRGHVCLMYGKPYITIDGYLYHAHESKEEYKLASRPLTPAERQTYQVPEGAHAWVSEVIMADGKKSFIGLGVVTQDEMTELAKGKPGQLRSPVVARHPWQMAQKRAEWQSLRRAFPIGGPEEGASGET